VAVLKGANLLVRFLLELAALAALGWWGWRTGTSAALRWALAIGLPLAAAVLWGIFAAPKSALDVSGPVKVAVQALVLGAAAVALLHLGETRWAAIYGAVLAVNTVLMYVWHQ
jgi:hypothetical protein